MASNVDDCRLSIPPRGIVKREYVTTDTVCRQSSLQHRSRRPAFAHRGGWNIVLRGCGWCLLLAACFCGCRTSRPQTVRLPVRHSVQSEQLLLLSDFKLDKEHPLLVDLMELRKQVASELGTPLNGRQVVVYLFGSEVPYRQYLEAAYPGLPPRRAYFVGTSQELAVYTYWGERIQEDLRHEFTHGLLHSGLKAVPLWLDEGLAEYFEVVGDEPGGVNSDYAQRLSTAVANGWRPDMGRLEDLEYVNQMQRMDYQESWAWVHFMLHSSPETRDVLLTYLKELQHTADPGLLNERLQREVLGMNDRLVNYVNALNTYGDWAALH